MATTTGSYRLCWATGPAKQCNSVKDMLTCRCVSAMSLALGTPNNTPALAANTLKPVPKGSLPEGSKLTEAYWCKGGTVLFQDVDWWGEGG